MLEDATPAEAKYLDDYASALGKLIGNLGSLEFAIRVHLHAISGEPEDMQLHSRTLLALPVGTSLAENWVTSWRSLGQLISEYNRLHLGADAIPDGIKDIRDMFAHGRIFADASRDVLHLVRFSKPKDGRVLIEANQPLPIHWIRDQNAMVRAALLLVPTDSGQAPGG